MNPQTAHAEQEAAAARKALPMPARREAARGMYADSVAAGMPVTDRELGEAFGRSARWGRARIAEVRAELAARAGLAEQPAPLPRPDSQDPRAVREVWYGGRVDPDRIAAVRAELAAPAEHVDAMHGGTEDGPGKPEAGPGEPEGGPGEPEQQIAQAPEGEPPGGPGEPEHRTDDAARDGREQPPVANAVETAGTAVAGLQTPPDETLRQLRRLRWAVRATLALGVVASTIANVLHARDNLISQAISAWPPLALLATIELISRVPVHRRSRTVLRFAATAAIAGIAAWVSYWHMVEVVRRYGETSESPYLIPLTVDGLVIVASVCLVELGSRIRAVTAGVAR